MAAAAAADAEAAEGEDDAEEMRSENVRAWVGLACGVLLLLWLLLPPTRGSVGVVDCCGLGDGGALLL